MSYTIIEGERSASWLSSVWQYFWEGFITRDWEDESLTNWESLGG